MFLNINILSVNQRYVRRRRPQLGKWQRIPLAKILWQSVIVRRDLFEQRLALKGNKQNLFGFDPGERSKPNISPIVSYHFQKINKTDCFVDTYKIIIVPSFLLETLPGNQTNPPHPLFFLMVSSCERNNSTFRLV